MKPYFDDGRIKLYHGDCREVLPFLSGFDLVLTDPQYQLASGKKANVNGKSSRRGEGRTLKGTTIEARDHGVLCGDDDPFDPRFLLEFPRVILWGAIHYAHMLPPSTRWLVWDKRDGQESDDNADCEMAWTNLKGPARLHHHLWRGICRAGEENIASAGKKLHPLQKPVGLMRWCLSFVLDALFVLDPFAGSGTTLLAAKECGMSATGIEIEEKYCEIAARRLSQRVMF